MRSLTAGLAACAALALPAAAQATYPGKAGTIAVIEGNSDRGGDGDTDLRLLGSSGKVVAKSLQHCAFHEFEDLPDESSCPSTPSFSRDGSRLAYAIDDRLAVSAADGTGRTILPRLTEADADPSWTPSGELLFTGRTGGRENLFLVRADGTGLKQLTRDGGRAGTNSSRGLVAYVAKGYVRLVRLDGTGERRLARGDAPDFSPSGSTVVYTRGNAVYRLALKRGAKRRRVVRRGSAPVFSPTGKRILFTRSADGRAALLTVTPKGKRSKRLFRSIDLSSAGVSYLADPAWQPRP